VSCHGASYAPMTATCPCRRFRSRCGRLPSAWWSFFYGLIQLDVPIIPTQLLVLMGLSVVTGGISYLAPPPQAVASTTGQPNPAGGAKIRPALSDLIRTFPNPGTPELSISRAQMLFWTVVTVMLFVSKSALEGGPWEVPWTLVGLMGISQAAYLFPKYYHWRPVNL
jgi:hypothetical protein